MSVRVYAFPTGINKHWTELYANTLFWWFLNRQTEYRILCKYVNILPTLPKSTNTISFIDI